MPSPSTPFQPTALKAFQPTITEEDHAIQKHEVQKRRELALKPCLEQEAKEEAERRERIRLKLEEMDDRRREQEAKEEAGRRERIRVKLEAMGPLPQSVRSQPATPAISPVIAEKDHPLPKRLIQNHHQTSMNPWVTQDATAKGEANANEGRPARPKMRFWEKKFNQVLEAASPPLPSSSIVQAKPAAPAIPTTTVEEYAILKREIQERRLKQEDNEKAEPNERTPLMLASMGPSPQLRATSQGPTQTTLVPTPEQHRREILAAIRGLSQAFTDESHAINMLYDAIEKFNLPKSQVTGAVEKTSERLETALTDFDITWTKLHKLYLAVGTAAEGPVVHAMTQAVASMNMFVEAIVRFMQRYGNAVGEEEALEMKQLVAVTLDKSMHISEVVRGNVCLLGSYTVEG
jgi:hypothetical protein